jgi:hypothetical protein
VNKVVQFPKDRLPVGAAMTQTLVRNLKAMRGAPSERDMVDEAGNLNEQAIEAVARWRAMHEFDRNMDLGVSRPFSEILAEHRAVERQAAEDIAACRKACLQVQGLPLHDRLIRSLEWELYRAEHGLGMPYDAENVARIRARLVEARHGRAAEQFPTAQE